MSKTPLLAILVLLGPLGAATASDSPGTWEGLELRPTRGLDLVYVRPGVQFKAYTSVLIDAPVGVAFDRAWDPNRDVHTTSRRLSTQDIQRMRDEMSTEFRAVFADELGKGGYSIVEQPGELTLRVSASLADVYINAPDRIEPGRVTVYTVESGRMTLEMELRDGPTGQLLARVVDEKVGDDTGTLQLTNSVTNSADFRRAVRAWARRLVKALDKVNGRD